MNKSTQLQIRVSTEQKARLRAAATRAGMDLSAYVLSCALPDSRRVTGELLERLVSDPMDTYTLAELNDVLESQTPAEFREATTLPPPSELDATSANYVAAMAETAARRKGMDRPTWTDSITPLREPWFATQMPSVRLYLLANSPAAFRRRNLFVDATLGGRV